MKRLAERWSGLHDDEEKKKYQKLAEDDKLRYENEMDTFRGSGQQEFSLSATQTSMDKMVPTEIPPDEPQQTQVSQYIHSHSVCHLSSSLTL